MKTLQDLTKQNLLLKVPYEFFKDFRWVDMSVGTDEAPRWAYIAKSWNPDTFSGENGKNVLVQSYTVEFWIPRDGRGFLWDEAEADPPDGWEEDSSGEGTLRLLVLWTETDLSVNPSDDLILGTVRFGIDQNYTAVDKFLTGQAED